MSHDLAQLANDRYEIADALHRYCFGLDHGDADSLADVLLKLAKDPELCARNGAENRARIHERYDSLRMCKETVSVLSRL